MFKSGVTKGAAAAPALPLDASFEAAWAGLKKERKLTWVTLTIAGGAITVLDTGAPPLGVRELMAKLPDRHCCFVVLDHRYETDDKLSLIHI